MLQQVVACLVASVFLIANRPECDLRVVRRRARRKRGIRSYNTAIVSKTIRSDVVRIGLYGHVRGGST